jgi:hypothetical protein
VATNFNYVDKWLIERGLVIAAFMGMDFVFDSTE